MRSSHPWNFSKSPIATTPVNMRFTILVVALLATVMGAFAAPAPEPAPAPEAAEHNDANILRGW
ncbi:hypothetical protein BDW22DRAFT_1349910 [Trametopsis cervina]|nr:hypothetical protein BDW22DRAFT_1349910 [Trametopsis cervina]